MEAHAFKGLRGAWVLAVMCLAISGMAQSDLRVEVELNRPAAGGVVRVALCPSAQAYATEKGCLVQHARAESGLVQVVFPEQPEGRFAIKAFHDVNGNGKIDTNFLGIPNEPYGFSNDAMGTFGPPSFDQASFQHSAGSGQVRFRMKG